MKSVIICGATATGKTELSLKIAGDQYEIVSADSVQVYKYFNIGSGKPEKVEIESVKHYMLDLVEPDFPFSVGDFCRYAIEFSKEIENKGKIPMFVGGTGLYIDSFFKGLADIPDIKHEIRDKLEKDLEKNGLISLHDRLKKVDPNFAAKVHENDRQRILRGLQVFIGTGKTLTSYYSSTKGAESENTIYIGIVEDREILKKRIDNRVDSMIQNGFVDEVKSIRDMGFGSDLKSMRSIGYFEINRYLENEISYDETISLIKTGTKRYAKRQMTWFKRNKKINWFKREETEKILRLLDKS